MSRTDLLPDAGPVLPLRQAIYRAGRDYKGGITALAFEMVLDNDTLQKKLKLDEERRWLNPDELEEVIRLTADPRLLDALMRPAGAVWYRPVPGILGIASGAFVVAAVSATSVGLILSASATAFTVLKYAGAAYLLYLGFKSWRSDRFRTLQHVRPSRPSYRFLEAASLQFLNPKAIFFFLAVFPQFIDTTQAFLPQFFKLVASYAVLVILVHGSYALLANAAKGWLSSPKGSWLTAKVSGVTFAGFGLLMASATR
jgi:threonine/homoserine/homoserine lactone efflux protein